MQKYESESLKAELGLCKGEFYTKNGYFRYKGKDIIGNKLEINVNSEPTVEGLVQLREKVNKYNAKILAKMEEANQKELILSEYRQRLKDRTITVKEALQFLLYIRKNVEVNNYAQNTIKANENTVKVLSGYDFASNPVVDIMQMDAKKFINEIKDKNNCSGDTLKQYHSMLKMTFNEMVENGVININPFAFKLSTECNHREALTKTQQGELLNYVKNSEVYANYYNYIVVLLETGLRIGELLGLTIDDVDFDSRRLCVNKQELSDGKVTTQLKTNTSKRYVSLSDDAIVALQDIINNLPKKRKKLYGYSGYLFVTRNATPISHTAFQSKIREIRQGIQDNVDSKFPDITPHYLRHTYATNKAMEGMSVLELFKQMGHKDFNTTLRIYTHLTDDNGIEINKGLSSNEVIAKYETTSSSEMNSSNATDTLNCGKISDKVIKVDFSSKKKIS